MLNQQTIEIIKSTVPVLEKHGETITKRFYELMFGNYPELLHIHNMKRAIGESYAKLNLYELADAEFKKLVL